MKNLNNKILCLSLIAVLILSLTLTLCDAFIPWNVWTHPALNFFFFAFVGLGVIGLCFGIKNKSSWIFFIGTVLLTLAVAYITAQYVGLYSILCAVVFAAVLGLIEYMLFGYAKKSIALNDSPDYKDYKTRSAERDAEKKSEAKKLLPEIKSYK